MKLRAGARSMDDDAESNASTLEPDADSALTLTGAGGTFLQGEVLKFVKQREVRDERRHPQRRSLYLSLDQVEVAVSRYYDPTAGFLLNFVYDVLQLASGRDKFLSLIQGYAKFAATLVDKGSERFWMYRGVEESLSDSRKAFRLFKEIREVYKIRRGFHRMQQGIDSDGLVSVGATCGLLDVCGHCCSFVYFGLDNLLWAASVGIIRTKEIPKWQRGMWQGLWRKDGPTVSLLGGVELIERRRNLASIFRLVCAFQANVLLLNVARTGAPFQGPDDARLFHSLELLNMTMAFRILSSKLGYWKLDARASGLLTMFSAACGIWISWRKVRKKGFGTKVFQPPKRRRANSE